MPERLAHGHQHPLVLTSGPLSVPTWLVLAALAWLAAAALICVMLTAARRTPDQMSRRRQCRR